MGRVKGGGTQVADLSKGKIKGNCPKSVGQKSGGGPPVGLGGRHSHGVSPGDSHEILSTIGGGTQVDDFTKGQGNPDPLIIYLRSLKEAFEAI